MEVRNIKRRLAMVLCVCILCASAMPAALAEDVVQVQAATPSEAKPELAQMTISGASGSAGTLTLSVKGTAGKKVKVTLYTMDETELDNRTITLEGGSGSVQFTGLSAGTYAADVQYYDEASGNYTGKGAAFVENLNVAAPESAEKPPVEVETPQPTEKPPVEVETPQPTEKPPVEVETPQPTEKPPVEIVTPEPTQQPTPQPMANQFTAALYPGEGKLDVDVYGGSDLELTVTLTKPDGSVETRTIQHGAGIVSFTNLATGNYKVKVDYTTPVFNVQAYNASADVTAAGAPTPAPSQIEATASVSGQTLNVTITNAEDKEMVATIIDAAGKTQTAKVNDGQAVFTELAAGSYTLVIAYTDSSAGSKTITGITVESKASAQAITATAVAGVGCVDVSVTAASPLNVAVTLLQGGVIKETRAIAAGVGNVSFTNLAAGEYSVSIDYAPSQTGISPVVIDKLSVTAQAIGIAITKIVPGENKLTVSGTAKPNESITLSTVPEGTNVIAVSDANGNFVAELVRGAGVYTAVVAQYVGEESTKVTVTGNFVVTASAAQPTLDVDGVTNASTTVVAKTNPGITVMLTTPDYTQTLVADSRGIIRFTLPHTYARGTAMTLTVYYGTGNVNSFTRQVIVGNTPYYGLLKRGSRGEAVYNLTARLAELGYPISATRSYNDSVVAAVRLFQAANGLSSDGMAGKLTQAALFSVGAISYSEGNTYPTLVRGDRGMALIYTLQQRLKDLGYYTIRVDGIYGSATQRAIRWFQEVNGLSVTGKADHATQQLLYSSSAKAAGSTAPSDYVTLSRSNRYRAAVVPLQRRLKALGYQTGSIDGYYGSNTYRAVRNFQSRNGITVTGTADPYTQQILYSSSAKPASGSSSSAGSATTGYRLLYWGCKGDAVKRLQQALLNAGYKQARTADGIYGQWTYDAVRAFQKDHGLSVDGIAGKNTQNKLYGTNY